jgi:hypothetical protein
VKVAAALLGALLLLGSACGSETEMSAEAEAELIAAAVARRAFIDNSVSGARFATVEVVDQIGTSHDDGIRFSDDDRSLTDDEREAIRRTLAPAEVLFISSNAEPLVESDDRAVVTIAQPEGDDRNATIGTGVVCGELCGAGGAQRFELDDAGRWSFVENVGGQWVA